MKLKFAKITGRFQNFSSESLEALLDAYNISLSNSNGLIIGINRAYAPDIQIDEISERELEKYARFNDPKLNKFSYFERKIIIKSVLLENNADLSRVFIVPCGPKTLYNEFKGLMPKSSEIKLNYFNKSNESDDSPDLKMLKDNYLVFINQFVPNIGRNYSLNFKRKIENAVFESAKRDIDLVFAIKCALTKKARKNCLEKHGFHYSLEFPIDAFDAYFV